MAKTTPTPWNIGENKQYMRNGFHRLVLTVYGPERAPVCKLHGENARANAHLIYAAPEMLEILKWCQTKHEANPDWCEGELGNQIAEVIRKAQGGDT